MVIERFEVGTRFFVADVFQDNVSQENMGATKFSMREEAEAEGQDMADNFDPEWQKRHPNRVTFQVAEWECDSVGDGGECEGAFEQTTT